MTISLIVAISNNGVIGCREGGIPWHLPRDRSHFRNYTAGKWLLLGRTTFQEMDGWFTDQTPLVLTSKTDLKVPHGYRVKSVEEAIYLARQKTAPELVICGGAEVYRQALPFVKKMIVTRVDTEVESGICFPNVEEEEWELTMEETFPADQKNEFQMTFQILTRKETR